jgi:hypothetical protein
MGDGLVWYLPSSIFDLAVFQPFLATNSVWVLLS